MNAFAAEGDAKSSELYALAAEDGRLLWRIPDATPVSLWLFDHTLIWVDADGSAVVSDAGTGEERSRLSTPMSYDTVERFGDIHVAKNVGDDLLTALDGETGQVLWRLPKAPDREWAYDVYVTGDRALAHIYEKVLAEGMVNRLVAFDVTTGAIAWTFAEPISWFDADAAYVYTRTKQGAFYALDTATGAVKYRMDNYTGSILHADGVVYFLELDKRRAFAPESGKQLWRRRNSELERDLFSSGGWTPQFISEDFLYVGYAERQSGCLAYNCMHSYRLALIARDNGDMTHLVNMGSSDRLLYADADFAWLVRRHEGYEVLAVKSK